MAWIYLVFCWGRATHICFNPLFVSLFLLLIRILSRLFALHFLAFYSLFSCSMQSQLNWIVISMYIGIVNMLYIFQIKSILKTKKQTKKTQPNDTFNRFHSPVIVHRKHEGAVTRHAFLLSSARKHLQLQGGAAAPHTPCLQVLFFWLRQWMLVFIWYILNVYSSTTNLWSLYHSPDTCEADKIWYFSIYMYCLWKC